MSKERVVYSIQQTYIIKPVYNSENRIFTCDERIDIPTIEPLTQIKTIAYPDDPKTVVPCIELAGEFLSEFNLTFETNEGETVLPVKIDSGFNNSSENPYMNFRYVLVLPRGATGIKSCKLIHKATGKEVQHNFTFGIMPPPYNYENSVFWVIELVNYFGEILNFLNLTTVTPALASIDLPKGAGRQTINIEEKSVFYETEFTYYSSAEPTIHKPKIRLHRDGEDLEYTLSLNRPANNVSIDLFTGMITVYGGVTGEIMQQFKLTFNPARFKTLSFENFDDIDKPVLRVNAKGARVK